MNDLTPAPVDVQAPFGAFAWTASRGFIDHLSELTEARLEGEVVFDVTDALGVVEAVEGDAPLAVVVRLDRHVLELQRVVAALAETVSDLGDRVEGVDASGAVELAHLRRRVRRLEE